MRSGGQYLRRQRRYDWYQSGTTVTVEFFVKGLKEADYKVHFEEQEVGQE